ncbi:GSCOCG00007922001-RA-CDS [Cotesia congregata]|uniref:Uncharacterized protein n=1 Tax=Cotesia congregata TaxID=51543 RepID=A0A8J2HJ90_COTCN|nr:GSCOCG00007922001-RA-CDS [Cotesia congregata]CAG5100797.1 Protein of unknown function [Cotesia congregata]
MEQLTVCKPIPQLNIFLLFFVPGVLHYCKDSLYIYRYIYLNMYTYHKKANTWEVKNYFYLFSHPFKRSIQSRKKITKIVINIYTLKTKIPVWNVKLRTKFLNLDISCASEFNKGNKK